MQSALYPIAIGHALALLGIQLYVVPLQSGWKLIHKCIFSVYWNSSKDLYSRRQKGENSVSTPIWRVVYRRRIRRFYDPARTTSRRAQEKLFTAFEERTPRSVPWRYARRKTSKRRGLAIAAVFSAITGRWQKLIQSRNDSVSRRLLPCKSRFLSTEWKCVFNETCRSYKTDAKAILFKTRSPTWKSDVFKIAINGERSESFILTRSAFVHPVCPSFYLSVLRYKPQSGDIDFKFRR